MSALPTVTPAEFSEALAWATVMLDFLTFGGRWPVAREAVVAALPKVMRSVYVAALDEIVARGQAVESEGKLTATALNRTAAARELALVGPAMEHESCRTCGQERRDKPKLPRRPRVSRKASA